MNKNLEIAIFASLEAGKEIMNIYNSEFQVEFKEDKNLNMNDICRVQIRTTRPLMVDAYRLNRITGSFNLEISYLKLLRFKS